MSNRPSELPSMWAWLAPNLCDTPNQWRERLSAMRDVGIRGIFCSYNGPPDAGMTEAAREQAAKFQSIVEVANDLDIQIHAWTQLMPCNSPEILEAHPDWYVVNGRGESAAVAPAYVDHYRFLCPSREDVQQYLERRLRRLASIDGVAGVHLDYIRFPDVILAKELQPKYGIVQDREYPEYDYCYCDACRFAFREESGVDPSDLDDPAESEAWRKFRYDRITGLVNDVLTPAVREYGKLVTAAVFPNWEHVRQEWFNWHLDAAFPMLYHQFYGENIEWIGLQCKRLRGMLPTGIGLWGGLYIPALSPQELSQAIESSTANGADGVSLFDAAAMMPAHWHSLSKSTRSMSS